MTEITLPADLHGCNPEADRGHSLVQLPDLTKKIVLFEAVYLNLCLRVALYTNVTMSRKLFIFSFTDSCFMSTQRRHRFGVATS